MDSWYWKAGWIPSAVAILGNGLVIYVVTTRRKLRTTTNRFVLSLAIADFCVGCCFYPGQVICHYLGGSCYRAIKYDIAIMAVFASVTNLCAMTLDRYIAIVQPLRYMSLMTSRRASMLAAVAWLVPGLAFFVPSFCASLGFFRLKHEVSVIIWSTLFEFFPSVFLLLTSARAVLTARKHCRYDTKVQNQLRYNQTDLRSTRSASSAKVIGTVVAIFLICYAVEIYSSFCHFTALCTPSEHMFSAVLFLVITNSAANPIAYTMFKRDIKSELCKVFCGKRAKLKVFECYRARETATWM